MNDAYLMSLLVKKAEDIVVLSEKHFCLKHTGFLSPAEAAAIREKHISGRESRQEFYGGYDDAERVMFISYPDYYESCPETDFISVLLITGRDIASLSHRDYLGSILGLGIKREKIGDILVGSDKTYVFVSADIAKFIADNLTKIGRRGVSVLIRNAGEITVPAKKTENLSGTVQSVRLDSVLSVALKTSRTKVLKLIESENVQVNWKVVSDASFKMKEDDVFSVRGFGRFKLSLINGTTKKGRISITVQKYL